MVDPVTTRRWLYRAVFVALALAMAMISLAPLSTAPVPMPWPDLLLCLCYAWVLRRPDYLPAVLIAAVFLLTDMLYMRPPGLWTALVLVGAEFLRGRHAQSRELPFSAEFAMVAGVMLTVTLAYQLLLGMAFVVRADLGLVLLRLLTTLLAYPVVVYLSRTVLGVRAPVPGGLAPAGGRD